MPADDGPLRRGGFHDAWHRLVGAWVPPPLIRRGRKPRVPVGDLLAALTYHVLSGPGTLAEHFTQLFPQPLSDGAWADRRARLPWAVFASLLQQVLRPMARPDAHPDAFWRGWRLVALDGTQFSVRNTPQVAARRVKAQTRRGPAAFAKITTTVLVEVGLHHPLAAAIGPQGDSEWALARALVPQIPAGALLLADRLYGVPAFLVELAATCATVGSHFLVRARPDVKRQVVRVLADGSRLVRVARRDPESPAQIRAWLDVREITCRVGRAGHRAHTLRLWTTLLDPATAPALDLAPLYAQRWEQELYFREVKREVRGTALVQSHTVETAAQEIAALILASAILAGERVRAAADGHVPVRRVSFPKLLAWVRATWLTLAHADDLFTPAQRATFLERMSAQMGHCLTKPRRSRSVPRAVRQPVRHWPRVLATASIEGPLQFEIC